MMTKSRQKMVVGAAVVSSIGTQACRLLPAVTDSPTPQESRRVRVVSALSRCAVVGSREPLDDGAVHLVAALFEKEVQDV